MPLDQLLKGKSLRPKIIVVKEEKKGKERRERERRRPYWTMRCPHSKNQPVIDSDPFKRGIRSPARDSLHLACFPHLLSSCACKRSGLQLVNIWVYNLGFIDLPFPQQGKDTSLTVYMPSPTQQLTHYTCFKVCGMNERRWEQQ